MFMKSVSGVMEIVIPISSLVTDILMIQTRGRIQWYDDKSQLSMKGYSNKRKEFNPETPDIAQVIQQFRNASFHPVAAAGQKWYNNFMPAACGSL